MAKGASKSVVEMLECWEALVNTDELEAATEVACRRVLEIQAKLHRWARDDPHCRFDDVFNLVADPAFLLVAWDRVRHNKGAKTAGVDGQSAYYVQAVLGVEEFLGRLRTALRDRSFRPVPVRERMIPKAGGKQRRLGIATVTDRVVQASLTLVLEPILEADSCRVATASVPDGGLMTRSPRPAIWRPAPMSGSLRVTSRRVSMRLRIRP
jgi:RNA-directed DNA polymerase